MELYFLTSSGTGTGSGTSGGGTEALKEIFTKPAFYIVIGVIVLLILAFVIYRRFVRAQQGQEVVIVRHGQIHKILTSNDKKYFLRFFKDRVGLTVNKNEIDYASDKVLINDGPDALYKLHFVLKYKILDSREFYPNAGKLNEYLVDTLNDQLRSYAKANGASLIVREFDENKKDILNFLNKFYKDISIEITDFRIKAIEPLGSRR